MSRKRRNSFEALQIVDKKREEKEKKEMKKSVVKKEVVKVENVEVVKMEVCSRCEKEIKSEEVFIRHDLICCKECADLYDEADKLVEEDNKEMVKMNKVVRSAEELRLDNEMNKEWLDMFAKRDKLDRGIRNAIIKGKNETSMARCITKGQLVAIVKNYKVITGFDMNARQVEALKKLNANQVYYIEETIKYCLRKIREHNFNKRMLAKAN